MYSGRFSFYSQTKLEILVIGKCFGSGFSVSPDPDSIRFQGFDDQKLKKKNLQMKKIKYIF
jgi:hypothetical protein